MHDHYRTVGAFLFCVIAYIFMGIVQVWQQGRSSQASGKISDLAFDFLPFLDWPWLSSVFLIILLIATILVSPFTGYFELLWRRHFWMQGTLFALRALTISGTVFPDPRGKCSPHIDDDWIVWHGILTTVGLYTTCSDMMFSGHTVTFILLAFIWHQYVKIEWAAALVYTWVFIGILSLLVTRFHYIDDIIVAFMLTIGIIIIYHWSIYGIEFDEHAPFHRLRAYIRILDGEHVTKRRHQEVGWNYTKK